MRTLASFVLALTLALSLPSQSFGQTVFVEAESFQTPGGWVVDQQFMDQMGSPFLLAHGLGRAVKPASTSVSIPSDGQYRILVRTRDWAPPNGPGEFRIAIDGKELPAALGVNCGGAWAWHEAGKATLKAGSVQLSLIDKTGFDGRCDAIVLTTQLDLVPPASGKELAGWRKKMLNLPDVPPTVGKFDLVVIGGGLAGTGAAIAASRQGLSVALIHDRPVLGGNASSEIRVQPEGKLDGGPFPKLGDILNEFVVKTKGNASEGENYKDEAKLEAAKAEKGLKLFLNTHANAVQMDGNRIAAVIAQDVFTGREMRFEARVFADCTGDGTIGFLAGADWRMGREGKDDTKESIAPEKGDKLTMGSSNLWYAVKQPQASAFPLCPWALQFNAKNCIRTTKGTWDWEAGMDKDTIADAEAIRDLNFRAIYGNWAFIKNNFPQQYANFELDWVAYISGKRESRRLLGDVILQEQDFVNKVVFPDGCVPTGWHMDLHYATTQNTRDFPGQEFRTIVGPAPKVASLAVPYRCMYSRNIANLFMAGRNISVTHAALGPVRVMKTTGLMGVVVGRAAALCKKYDATPRQVYESHLPELKTLLAQPGK